MAKKEAYDEFVSLSEKLTHLVEIHGNKKTRHFSRYEIDLLNHAITQIEHIEKIVPFNSEISSIITEQKEKSNSGSTEWVTIDQKLLDSGKSINGGYSKKQREVLGINPPWPPNELNINQTIGWQITKKNADLFVKLKNKHIDLEDIKSKVKKSISWRQSAEVSAERLGMNVNTYLDLKSDIMKKKNVQTKSTKKSRKTATKKRKNGYSKKFETEAMKLIGEGYSGVEVSKILGVNKDTIRKWRKRHGLAGSSQKHAASTQNDVLDLIRDGRSNSEIAKLTGVSSTTVANWRADFEQEGF